MRFDDRLTTVLKGQLPEGQAAAAQWRQVIDLLAQKPGQLMNEEVQLGLTRLRDLHNRVDEADRVTAVRALAGRLRSAPLLVYLCADDRAVAEAALEGADLPQEIWLDILPQLPEMASDVLRDRAIIGEEMVFASDERQASAPVEDKTLILTEEHAEENSQISSLVAKIEDYQRKRIVDPVTPAVPEPADEGDRSYFVDNIDKLEFETDDSGTITWAKGPPRGAIVGVTIAEPTFDEGPGPDAYGAAAFRQRMPLENARMRLCGAPVLAGDWRMTAIPFFAPDTGRFRGYRGVMRRPNAAEDVSAQASVDIARREQLQQLIHELRTPLNAIIGFSEIIEQQLFGPASSEYRNLSRSIMDEARRMLAGFEDLDMAAKIDAGQLQANPGETAPDWLLDRLTERLQSLAHSKAVDLRISKAEPVRAFALDGDTVERIYARLLSAAIIACEEGEELVADLRTQIGPQPVNCFSLSRPSRIRGIDEQQLLDPSQGIEGEPGDTPLLGLGFSLRLVRNLARSANGVLTLADDKIGLTLPAVMTSQIGARETELE
ncbi:His Kinase A (phospho-acceptor) domain-containing protein [Parasphingorhabdus marina DSM 22363]|uniref:histidine kinase n=2 Tax=Parasphingorhabdus marina TaxID=394732 RepID=A0A1N6FST6_9SPHN|nr:His Kinase A (phospho-acceptor) domain-containing protein [Parasphingorhabdus marina DSM 22363]